MTSNATSAEAYLQELAVDRREPMEKLRATVLNNLPNGFTEVMSYGMLGYVVPHSIFPAGYHCDPKQPLPFISIASQKNHIAFYHMGLYGMPALLDWFVKAYAENITRKLDMGKGCVRFKNPGLIPFDLLAKLCQKVTVADWIAQYEHTIKK